MHSDLSNWDNGFWKVQADINWYGKVSILKRNQRPTILPKIQKKKVKFLAVFDSEMSTATCQVGIMDFKKFCWYKLIWQSANSWEKLTTEYFAKNTEDFISGCLDCLDSKILCPCSDLLNWDYGYLFSKFLPDKYLMWISLVVRNRLGEDFYSVDCHF